MLVVTTWSKVKVALPLLYILTICVLRNTTGGWVNKKIDLTAYAGSSVTLRFEV